MENLILSCHDCNHNKNSFWIEKEEMDTLNPDGEKIKNVFIRDDKYYIRINDEFKENTTIEGFYNKLCLGSELHRLDYLIMNIIGLQRSCEDNSDLYVGLGKILDTIREKRNIMQNKVPIIKFYLCNITQKNFCKEGSEFMDIKQLIGETTDYDKKLALEEKKSKS